MTGAHVFISHCSKDRRRAQQIAQLLADWSVKVWIAPNSIAPGKTYAAQILEAIDSAAAMLVLVTPAASESNYVHAEVERAFKRKVPLYPMRFEPIEPSGDISFYLSAMHWIDAFGVDREDGFERLAHDLGGIRPEAGSLDDSTSALEPEIGHSDSFPDGSPRRGWWQRTFGA